MLENAADVIVEIIRRIIAGIVSGISAEDTWFSRIGATVLEGIFDKITKHVLSSDNDQDSTN